MFNLSFCDQPKNFLAVVHHLLVFFHLFRNLSLSRRKNTSRRLNPRECWGFPFQKATSFPIQEVSVRTRPCPISALKTGCKPPHCLTQKKGQSSLGDRHNVETPPKNVCHNRTPVKIATEHGVLSCIRLVVIVPVRIPRAGFVSDTTTLTV